MEAILDFGISNCVMSQADAVRIWRNGVTRHTTIASAKNPRVRLATVSIQPWMYQFRHHAWLYIIYIYRYLVSLTISTNPIWTKHTQRTMVHNIPLGKLFDATSQNHLTSKDHLARQSPTNATTMAWVCIFFNAECKQFMMSMLYLQLSTPQQNLDRKYTANTASTIRANISCINHII